MVERRFTQFVRVPPCEILVFLMNFIFFGKTRQLYGVKSILPFSKLIIGRSQVFLTQSYVYLPRYTQIRDRRAQCGLTASWVGCNGKKKIVQRDPNMKFEAEMRGFLVAASREDHRRPNFCRGWFLSVVAIFAWRGGCSTVLGHFASFEIWGGCGI